MPDRLRWNNDKPGHWSVDLDQIHVGDITRTDRFEVASEEFPIRGTHDTFDAAAAQVAAWVRWTNEHPTASQP